MLFRSILLLLPLLVLVAKFFGRKLKSLSTSIQDQTATLSTLLEEVISGIRVVKSFVQTKREEDRFRTQVQHGLALSLKRATIMAFFVPVISLLTFSAAAAVLEDDARIPAPIRRSLEPLLRVSGAGRVVHLTTSLAKTPRAFWGAYAATKAGAEAMMKAWADEIESTPVRVCVVDPGRMRTAMRAQAYPGEDPEILPHPSEIGPLIVELARGDMEPPLEVSFRDWRGAPSPSALV